MATAEYVKQIISDNKNDIAFIIGNGIHNYFYRKVQDYKCMAWSELLESLWRTFANGKPYPSFMDCQYGSGISNTEFFNLLEIEFLSNHKSKKLHSNPINYKHLNTKYIEKLKKCQDNDNYQTLEMLSKQSSSFSPFNFLHTNNYIMKSNNILMDFAQEELGVNSENAIDKINIISRAIFDKSIFLDLSEPIKKEIAHYMRDFRPVSGISKIVEFIKNIKAPILTTNYDTVLSKSIGINDNDIRKIIDKKNNSISYDWSFYFGEETNSPLRDFGIWHIHGLYRYHKSISIGATDYMKNVQVAIAYLPNKINLSNLEDNDWYGSNTWLSIIFNKSLFMFGLKLDIDETFIRWLLILRYKYMVVSGKIKKAWYVVSSSENIPCTKKYFLESVGFEIVKVPNWDILYEKVWE